MTLPRHNPLRWGLLFVLIYQMRKLRYREFMKLAPDSSRGGGAGIRALGCGLQSLFLEPLSTRPLEAPGGLAGPLHVTVTALFPRHSLHSLMRLRRVLVAVCRLSSSAHGFSSCSMWDLSSRDLRSKPNPLYCKADSQPLDHRGGCCHGISPRAHLSGRTGSTTVYYFHA